MSRPRVLLAEDHAGVAASLTFLLQDDFEIVATVRDGQALIDTTRKTRPDVIVTDIEMPGKSGVEALRELRAAGDDVPVIFLTAHADPLLADRLIRLGAAGYLLKRRAGEELLVAIGQVLQGHIYVTTGLSTVTRRERGLPIPNP